MIPSKYVDGSFVHQVPKTNNKPGFYKSLRVVDRQNSAVREEMTFLRAFVKNRCYFAD